jgi:NAD(P)-dependent dehydrogenase (short-subunit alcohol dehydrogenase family)
MTREEKFLLGAITGAAAMIAGARAMRNRHGIEFRDRVIVITGGSRGLGLVIARQLAAEGARLVLLARDPEELARARAQLPADAEVMTLRCDVRRRADIRAAMDEVLGKWTAVDVLINNAGVVQVGPLEHMTHEDFENAMATHFWGPLHLMFELVPGMRHRGFGRIVNISSIGGRVALPHFAPYSASKFALVGLSDAVRAELDQYGIRVTTVCPGLMRTGSPLNADIKGQHEAEYAWFAIADSTPGLSVSAERAARQIIEACRFGDPDLTIGLPAHIAIVVNNALPTLSAHVASLANRLLPKPAGRSGDQHRRGRDTESKWTDGIATALTDRAAVANNEI